MKNKYILFGVVGVIILVAIFYIASSSKDPQYSSITHNIETPPDQNLMRKSIYGKRFANNPDTISSSLIGIDGSDDSAVFYILKDNGEYFHMVEASLPDLPEGVSYEEWLVNTKTGAYISTGVFEKTQEGTYMLHYQEELEDYDFDGYNQIVITREEEIDDIPEIHVLEGEIPSS